MQTPCGHIGCFPVSCTLIVNRELLTDLLEYFEESSDLNNEGGPNKSMQFATWIKEFLD